MNETEFKVEVKSRCVKKMPKHNEIDGDYLFCRVDQDFCDMNDCPIINRYFTKRENEH
jgi:hypothetical protein